MKDGGSMSERNEKEVASIPRFAHEAAMEHYNTANKRMLIAIISICITFILTIVIFVVGYTIRTKNWLDTICSMQQSPPVVEVQRGDKPD